MPNSRRNRALHWFNHQLRLVTSEPLALWLATELPYESGGVVPDPFVELVADVEAEGSALIGAGPSCEWKHGEEDPEGNVTPSLWLTFAVCPACGAAL